MNEVTRRYLQLVNARLMTDQFVMFKDFKSFQGASNNSGERLHKTLLTLNEHRRHIETINKDFSSNENQIISFPEEIWSLSDGKNRRLLGAPQGVYANVRRILNKLNIFPSEFKK